MCVFMRRMHASQIGMTRMLSVCAYVCVCTCMYVCKDVCVCVYIYVCKDACVYVCLLCVCVFMCRMHARQLGMARCHLCVQLCVCMTELWLCLSYVCVCV